jgi:SAM-dependent methyltransferase
METKDVKDFYNKSVGESKNSYEYDRWQKNSQGKASYISTLQAVEKFALPYLNSVTSVFELGPGPGTWTKVLLQRNPTASYDLVDISEEMLKQAKAALSDVSNIRFINSDILDFVTDKKYQFFFSSRIIEYVPNKEKAVQIISNSLEAGSYGYIVTKTPHPGRFWGIKNNSAVHQTQVAPAELKCLFEKADCEIVKVVNVTSVFPGLRSGGLDRLLTVLCGYLSFTVTQYVSESYAIIFKKK